MREERRREREIYWKREMKSGEGRGRYRLRRMGRGKKIILGKLQSAQIKNFPNVVASLACLLPDLKLRVKRNPTSLE